MLRTRVNRVLRFFSLMALLAVVMAPFSAEAASSTHVLPSNAKPYGKTYGEWSAKWWQYALNIPASENPLLSEGAVDCTIGQQGTVWNLVGVINASGVAERTCTVPAGRALFVPVLNLECSNVEAPPFFGANEADLRSCVTALDFGNLHASVDGKAVPNLGDYLVESSPVFHFQLPADNVLGVPGPTTGIAMGRGVHVMIPPLSVGEHTIRFGGTFTDFEFSVDLTYHLTVRPAR